MIDKMEDGVSLKTLDKISNAQNYIRAAYIKDAIQRSGQMNRDEFISLSFVEMLEKDGGIIKESLEDDKKEFNNLVRNIRESLESKEIM